MAQEGIFLTGDGYEPVCEVASHMDCLTGMKSRTVCLVVAVILLGSCTRSASGQLPTPDQLSEALPTITEMPGEWDESQRQVFTVRGPENPSIDPSVWCPDAQEVTNNLVEFAGNSGADVEMQADLGKDAARMMRLQAWSNNDVENYFRDAREGVRICDGKTITSPDGVTESYDVIEGRDIGDESISWRQTTTPPASTQDEKFETIGRTTIARFGSIIMVLQIGDASWSGSGQMMDEDAWWDIVELAGKKLNSLDEQVHD